MPKSDGWKNLIPYKGGDQDTRTPEERKRNAQLGAKASAEVRRRKKRLTDAAKWLLASKDIVSDAKVKAKLQELGIEDATNAEALMVIALKKASTGNVEALKFVRDTGGEAPSNRVELAGDIDRPVATLDLRGMSEEELLRIAESRADETGEDEAL